MSRQRVHRCSQAAAVCLAALLGLPCGCSKKAPAGVPTFDGERAFALLERQVEIGDRVPGTPAHVWTYDYLREALSATATSITVQPFAASGEDTSISFFNLIGHFNGTGAETVLLGTHWDTRAWADQDPNPANRHTSIAGANDGASGVAVLLELARILSETPPPRNVDIVLFDGEDCGEIANLPWCMGSSFYARALGKRPDFGIIVDLVGDKDLGIYVETNSQKYAFGVVDRIWKTARDLGISQFHREARHTVVDDHLALIQAGVPTALIIDFDYPYWHTLEDRPDKCSPASLEAVGRVLTAVVYAPAP
jgi:glutaminyl-peptide cyclotransferase